MPQTPAQHCLSVKTGYVFDTKARKFFSSQSHPAVATSITYGRENLQAQILLPPLLHKAKIPLQEAECKKRITEPLVDINHDCRPTLDIAINHYCRCKEKRQHSLQLSLWQYLLLHWHHEPAPSPLPWHVLCMENRKHWH